MKAFIYFLFIKSEKYEAYNITKLKSIKVGFDECRGQCVFVCPECM